MGVSEFDVDHGFQIGRFKVWPQRYRIESVDGHLQLEPKVMAVLVCLVRARNRLVTHDELIAAVWGPGGATSDLVSRAIGRLRRTLDTPGECPLIETVRGRGYYLHGAEVSPLSAERPGRATGTPLWARPAMASAATLGACAVGWALICWIQVLG